MMRPIPNLPKGVKFCLIALAVFQFFPVCPTLLPAQSHSQILIARSNTGAYRTIERSDWSRYDNGKYTGHVYRETRATLNPAVSDASVLIYRGNFFVLEETLRDMRQSARAVNDVIPVSFRILPNGDVLIDDDKGFPSLRGFPAFPAEPVWPGSKWTARGVRVVDPLNEGYPVAVPLVAEYEYQGVEVYQDIPVHRISARYASRFQAPSVRGNSGGVQYFTSLQGTHQVDILLRVSDGLPLLIRDNMDETFTWAGGATLRFRGFTLTFGEGTVPLNADSVISSIRHSLNAGTGPRPPVPGGNLPVVQGGNLAPAAQVIPANQGTLPRAQGNPEPVLNLNDDEWEKNTNIELAAVPGGVRLTIKDIRFVPDSDEFLAAEYPRLDMIAEALRQIPDRSFLVEGHTAAIGQPQAEMELSVLRAKRMVDELSRRGISADRFMYKGWGGEKPLGDNSTDAGRALNRRVEITILE